MSFNLKRVQKKLNIIFNEPKLLEQALTHRSIGKSNNERLEFLGDSILGFVIADKIYEKFPDADEGIMSRLRANLVNKHTLADLAETLELGDELILGPGELKSGGRNRKSILSDAFEAIIGSIYKDSDFQTSCNWVATHFADKLNQLSTDAAIKDPKTRLQEFLQSRGEKVPTYTVISTTGLDHNQLFTIECFTGLLDSPQTASANSRKKAEQKAAEKILEALNEK